MPEELCCECDKGLIIFDRERGERRCENCGAVIEDRLVRPEDAPGKLSPGAKPGGFTRKFDKDHTGKRVKAPWGIERQDSNERAENEIRDIVVRICDVAQPPDKDGVAAGAIHLYRRYLKEKTAKKLPTPVERRYLAAATVLFVCRERKFFCDMRAFCLQVGVAQKTVRQYMRLLQRLGGPALVSSTDYVAAFCSGLALNWNVQRRAKHLLDGRTGNPRTLAATAIVVAAEQLGIPIGIKEVGDVSGVTAETISRNRRRF